MRTMKQVERRILRGPDHAQLPELVDFVFRNPSVLLSFSENEIESRFF